MLNKTINLIGNGSGNTIIHGENSNHIISISANWCNISGFNLTNTETENSTDHSIIYAGIIINSNYNIIFNNRLFNNGIGIIINGSKNNLIKTNSCEYNNEAGIKIFNGYNTTIMNNSICNNRKSGISIANSQNISVLSNHCDNNSMNGVSGEYIRNLSLEDNQCKNNSLSGFYFTYIDDSFIINNNLISNKDGLKFSGSNNQIVSNRVHDNQFSGFSISGGTNHNNIVEKNEIFTNHIGIYLDHSFSNIINQNIINLNDFGVRIELSHNNKVNYNSINSNSNGIYADNSKNNSFRYNELITNSEKGFHFYKSNNNIIESNIIRNNNKGIYLAKSNEINISNNLLCDNNHSVNSFGIKLESSSNVNMSDNIIQNNSLGVVIISFSQMVFIQRNQLENNIEFGINATHNNGIIVTASYNDWGYDSGPNHEIRNPLGQGDKVSNNVIYEPWIINNPTTTVEEENGMIPILIIVGVISISLFGLIISNGHIRMSIFMVILFPLYTKLTRDDIINQGNRRLIYDYLINYPGAHFALLKRTLPIGSGTIQYHLRVLENEGYIKSQQRSKKKQYFITKSENNVNLHSIESQFSPNQQKIVNYLRVSGPSTMKKIGESLSIKQTTVSYNVRQLVLKEIIKGDGRFRNCQFGICLAEA